MDDVEKLVKQAIDEEHEIEALTQKEIEWMENTVVVEGPGLSSQGLKFLKGARRDFPEFILEWNKGAFNKNIVVNLLVSEGRGFPKEDYLSACKRVVVEIDVNTRDISKRRVEEFTAFAAGFGISVTFCKVAELPREVIERVCERLFGGKSKN